MVKDKGRGKRRYKKHSLRKGSGREDPEVRCESF